MNSSVKSGFLSEIFLPYENLIIDYDFRTPANATNYAVINLGSNKTGYLEYNLQIPTQLQYSGSEIINTGNPAITISDSGSIPFSLISGHFNGKTKYKILGNLDSDDWTFYLTFKHLETGLFTQNKVLLSNKDYYSGTSGFIFGINGCNRLFYEYNINNQEKRIFTLNKELDNKNLASLSKIDNDLFIGLHQYEDLNSFSIEEKFALSGYNPSYTFYLGGVGNSGNLYRNFSGYIDQFVFIDRGLQFPERNTFSEAFFCSGYSTGYYQGLTNVFNTVTGLEYQTILVGTGITGYSKYLDGYTSVDGVNVPVYSYSGITGLVYEEKLIELTGTVTGDYELATLFIASGLPDFNYILNFSNSKILSFNDFDDSYKEVYSFSGKNSNDINLNANYLNANNKFSILSTGSGETINLYVNGLAEPFVQSLSSSYTGDFTLSGKYLDSDNFFDQADSAVYDLIFGSGSISGISVAQENSGFAICSPSFVANRDIYLNGIKLISGVDFYSNASGIVINPAGLVAGDLLFLPKHTANLNRYTGLNTNNFDTSLKLFDEQVWINGLRQIKYADYEKIPDFSLKYSSFSLEPYADIIYNNDTGFFNV